MADDLIIQTADAIKAVIGSQNWGFDFALDRSYVDIDADLDELDRARVDVTIPEDLDAFELDSQADEKATVTYEIAIRKRFDLSQQDNAAGGLRRSEVDRLVNLTLSMMRYFTADRFANLDANVAWTATNLAQLYDRSALRERHTFVGIIELTFEISQTRS